MVDDIEIIKRTQAALAAAQVNTLQIQPVSAGNTQGMVGDAVDLSASARDIVTETRQSTTIAEAWLQQKIQLPDVTDPDSSRDHQTALSPVELQVESEDDSAGQRSLSRAFNAALNDISWLIDALGVGKFDVSRVAEVVARSAAKDGVGVHPPISSLIMKAEQSDSTAALYMEGLSVTVQKSKTVDASVERVAVTSVNPSMSAGFTGTDRPIVLDVGGELQQVAASATDSDTAQTSQDNADKAAKVAEILLATSMQPTEDSRHGLVIVRAGGTLYPEGTLKLKMDVLQPIR